MVQLTRTGMVGSVSIEELERQFAELHVFRLPQLLHPGLMQVVAGHLEECAWTTEADGKIAKEAAPRDPAPAGILNFAANTAGFLDLIRRIARCPEIAWFAGRVYRMEPAADHFDSWHADIGQREQDRLVGMSVNLGAPYQGGIFRMRVEATGEIVAELPNTVRGDAIFFRISRELKHMVTPVTGDAPKTAFAGWFRSGEDPLYSTLRALPPPDSAD